MSMGMSAGNHQTPNGTYYVQDKKPSVVMDSSTYGVPVNSTYGYKVTVDLAVGSTTSATSCTAPRGRWMTRASATSATAASTSPQREWFFDNFGAGDPIIVKNSSGGVFEERRINDWQS
jgi:hypothetical protein